MEAQSIQCADEGGIILIEFAIITKVFDMLIDIFLHIFFIFMFVEYFDGIMAIESGIAVVDEVIELQ